MSEATLTLNARANATKLWYKEDFGYEVNFTIEDVIREVIRLAGENKDHQYHGSEFSAPVPYSLSGGCSYLHCDEKLPCIFGQALMNLGVPIEILRNNEKQGISTVFSRLYGEYNQTVTLDTTRFCIEIQSQQDENYSWGTSVKKAVVEYPWTASKFEKELVDAGLWVS